MTSLGNIQGEAATPLVPRAAERPSVSVETRALIAGLSPAKRAALVACLDAADGLHKQNGAWHGALGGKPISGVTVADLARDGLLALSTDNRLGAARLTEQGMRCARTLRDDANEAR
jgi:hypothetical protein